jgi:serine protease Do
MKPLFLPLFMSLTRFLAIFVAILVTGWTATTMAGESELTSGALVFGVSADTATATCSRVFSEDGMRDSIVTVHGLAGDTISLPDRWSMLLGERHAEVCSKVLSNLASPIRGCGVVVRSDGYLVTNTDVTDGNESVLVRLRNGNQLEGAVIHSDENTGLALIKVAASGLTPATFAIPKQSDAGSKIMAIGGGPVLFGPSSIGTITDAAYNPSDEGADIRLILTNLPVIRGHDGGPLVNGRGQVVGINTRSHAKRLKQPGVGCAIPSDVVCEMLAAAIPSQQFESRVLGAVIRDVDVTAIERHPPFGHGAVVLTKLDPGGTADRSGLKRGDLILEFGGTRIDSAGQFDSLLNARTPGSNVDLVLVRDGERRVCSVRFKTAVARLREVLGFGVSEIYGVAEQLKARWLNLLSRLQSDGSDRDRSLNGAPDVRR